MKCQNESFKKHAIFGLEQEKPLVCSSYRKERMSDVIHKKCRTERYEKIPIFSLEQGKPLVCSYHQEEGNA